MSSRQTAAAFRERSRIVTNGGVGAIYQKVMTNADVRLVQEVARVEGTVDEAIDSRHDDGAGAVWPHGRFGCMLNRRAQDAHPWSQSEGNDSQILRRHSTIELGNAGDGQE